MAERRMFAKTIIDSDAFLDMPLSTQALYFHLCMRADDDGFINNAKKIQRMIGCSDDDIKILIAKSFIIPFETGIIVIKHWRIHNYIQNDRYKPSTYLEERSRLGMKKNNAYTSVTNPEAVKSLPLADTNDYECLPEAEEPDISAPVSNVYTQVSIGKDSIDEVSQEKVSVNEPKTAKKSRKEQEPKVKYAEFVNMAPQEYDKLVEKYGKPFTDKCIEVLDNAKGSKGYTYKSDYRAILSWVAERVEKSYPRLKVKPVMTISDKVRQQQNDELDSFFGSTSNLGGGV